MLDENQGAQPAPESEPVPAPEANAQPRDEQGRFASPEGEGAEPQAEDGAEAKQEEGQASDEDGERRPEERRNEPPAWAQRRIDELTRQRHEERRRAEQLEAELKRIREAGRPQEDGSQAQAEAQIRQDRPDLNEAQIREAARQYVEQERAAATFNEQCNRTFDEGKAKFSDFEARMQEFRHLGGLPQDFLEDVLVTGNAHAVLHHLGGDLNEADRIMAMRPRERTAALVRLSDKLSAPPPPKAPSRAPAPIAPVAGAGRPSTLNADPDSLSTEEWMRRRTAGEIR